MGDRRRAAVEVDEDIFGAPRDLRNPRAGEPRREVGRKGQPQVGPPDLDALDPAPLDCPRQAPANSFDFWQLRHGGRL